MLTSKLFTGEPLLEAIAADRDRISRTRNRRDPVIRKLQTALLDWDPAALPRFDADGDYGDESAAAVRRFKVTVLGVPAAQVIDDVGPQTVAELDRMQTARDPLVDRVDQWLGVPVGGVSSAVATGWVHAHDSGVAAFSALRDAIDACSGPQSFVVISGWDFYAQTPLAPGVTIGSALTDAAARRHVPVRALFGQFPLLRAPDGTTFNPLGAGDNTAATAFVNGLPGGAAIHDGWVLRHSFALLGDVQVGMHHQKVWAVYDGRRLRAFCGGVDLNPNRTPAVPPPLHDVQAEVRGDAAAGVYELLRQRWNDHPDRPAAVTLPAVTPRQGPGRNQCVRTFATYGNPGSWAGLGGGPGGTAGPSYPFAPAGSKAVREFLRAAIARTGSFVYLEDQYLVDASIGAELAARMPVLDGLVIVIPPDGLVNGELHQTASRRAALLAPLRPFERKVAVLTSPTNLVHSKTWIFDDTVALVGSANVNRRGYAHDSEACVAFGDVNEPDAVAALRDALWRRHLGPTAAAANAAPLSSVAIWKAASSSTGQRVDPYVSSGVDPAAVPMPLSLFWSPDRFWNEVVDPDAP